MFVRATSASSLINAISPALRPHRLSATVNFLLAHRPTREETAHEGRRRV